MSDNPNIEDSKAFITRKCMDYRKIVDEALEAGAMGIPKLEEAAVPSPTGFSSQIRITFVISELALYNYRQKKKREKMT